jgi:hypothetical protein
MVEMIVSREKTSKLVESFLEFRGPGFWFYPAQSLTVNQRFFQSKPSIVRQNRSDLRAHSTAPKNSRGLQAIEVLNESEFIF